MASSGSDDPTTGLQYVSLTEHRPDDNVSPDGDIDSLSGQPASSQIDTPQDPSTLDEPITATIYRDGKAVLWKAWHALYPKQDRTLLRDWDLWGPLFLCTILGILLMGSQSAQDKGAPEFAVIFCLVWVGSSLVTLNTQLLGGTISFFQSMCVLGYCLLPLTIALIISNVLYAIDSSSTTVFVVRCIVVLVCFIWSTFASTGFLVQSQPPERKALVIYPIGLFYFVISWMIISHK